MTETELYRKWIQELWNGTGDTHALHSIARTLVSADFVGHWPDKDVHGPDELADIVSETHSMFADLSFDIAVQPFAANGFVAARWTGRGTAQDGTHSTFIGNDILRIVENRIVEYWVATIVK